MSPTIFRVPAAGWLAGLALASAGCGSSGYVPVSGRVTLNGKPLAEARVAFQPDAGDNPVAAMGSIATTDADGQFTLRVIGSAKEPGAAPGKHTVAFSKTDIPLAATPEESEKPGAPTPKEVLPKRFNAESELKFEVPAAGTAEANFDLKTP